MPVFARCHTGDNPYGYLRVEILSQLDNDPGRFRVRDLHTNLLFDAHQVQLEIVWLDQQPSEPSNPS